MTNEEVKCMICGAPCSSWWMYSVGLAKEDRPMCFECMQKTHDKIIEEMAKAIIGKKE